MHKVNFKLLTHGSTDYKRAVALREEILRKPLGLTFRPEELAQEKDHLQIAGFQGDEICATAVLVPEGDTCKMQRVVVKQDRQNHGIGSAMMQFCEDYARAQGFRKIYCHARDTAVPFYLKNAYQPIGEPFNEDTIPHQKMEKVL